ncbi:MAG: TonB-dependent receptor, partial [Burkholderiales bacterium]|nr:TonB-dependent receptor [Burkholderiales bacterium]
MLLTPLHRLTGLALAALSLTAGAADEPKVEPAPAEPNVAAPAPKPATDGKTPQRVEIQGTPDSNTERRRSTASKIIYGREELDRMGDATLGEVLKRLPGVTIGGRPGRGGEIRMRGMGGGYTMIMIDGQRMPPGFSLDQIAPEQIERIEILRAPTADLTARAIAGIINVVMREDFKRKSNEFKYGGGVEEGGRVQAGANWVVNGNSETLGYNLGGTIFHQAQGNEVFGHQFGSNGAGVPNLDQFTHSLSEDKRNGLLFNGRLQFRLGQGNNLDLQPFINLVRNHNRGHSTLDQSLGVIPANYASADYATDSQTEMARVNGTWNHTTGDGGRLMLRFGGMLAHSASLTNRQEYSADRVATRLKVDDGSARDITVEMNGKYSQLLAERHSVAAGWDIHAGQRNDRRTTTENGLPTLTEFGDNIEARTRRLAAFAQDEWEWSKTFQFYAGLRWEGIQTQSDSLGAPVHNTSNVLAPLAHMVWKLPDAPRDQVRLSLTRSYKSPTTGQLIGRPSVSNLYPDLTKTNEPISPDRAGNPELKPELAWGL